MNWRSIGARIRKQREFMGYTREAFAELIDVTPKFCSDIELGVKGMSVPTLCKISNTLHLSTDYILFGKEEATDSLQIDRMLSTCTSQERIYAEQIVKTFVLALDAKKNQDI